MNYLLDTNVISELRRERPHGGVVSWLESVRDDDLTVSAVTIGELQSGIEKLRGRDDERADQLDDWLDEVVEVFDVIAVDTDVFRHWAKLMRGRPPTGWRDTMIAATALVHAFTVVTRNTKDFVDFGVLLLDPFAPR